MWTVLCLVVAQLTSTYGDDLLHTECDTLKPGTNTCYSVYSVTDPVTWDTARERCSERNSSLVTLPDAKSRLLARDTVLGTALSSKDYMWISGRRSTDRTWRYLDSTSFTGTLTGEKRSTRYCGKFILSPPSARSDSCVQRENHYALCQYHLSGTCRAADMQLHGRCFHMSSSEMTWFEARNYCRDYAEDGDLSTTILGSEQEFRDFVSDTSRGSGGGSTMFFWLALSRLSWQWENPDGATPIEYYAFGTDEGSDNSLTNCLLIHKTENVLRWVDRPCTDVSRYYMCTAVSEIDTSTSQVSEPFTEVMTSSSQNETSSESKSMSITTMYIIIAVCVAVVLSSVAVVIVIGIKKMRSPKSQPSNKFAHLSSRNITKHDITIVHELPNDIPNIGAGYCSTPEAELDSPSIADYAGPGRQNRLSMDDAYAEIPYAAPSGEGETNFASEGCAPYSKQRVTLANEHNDHLSNEYSNLPDLRLCFDQEVDENHFVSDLGDVYAMPKKSTTRLDNVIVDNPTYTSNNVQSSC